MWRLENQGDESCCAGRPGRPTISEDHLCQVNFISFIGKVGHKQLQKSQSNKTELCPKSLGNCLTTYNYTLRHILTMFSNLSPYSLLWACAEHLLIIWYDVIWYDVISTLYRPRKSSSSSLQLSYELFSVFALYTSHIYFQWNPWWDEGLLWWKFLQKSE